MGFLGRLFDKKDQPLTITTEARVTPDSSRCVQCGICSYNCPVGIDVRSYAFRGKVVEDPACIACGTCIDRCPRNTLRFAAPENGFLPGAVLGLESVEEMETFNLIQALASAGA